ncbi:MAG: hypothetical protein SVO01_02645 [Thermotogota bacterium]|nr:hypothetical protein [Thermotogota bacterium]
MTKIFLSHSHTDKVLLDDTKSIFEETNVEYVIYEGDKDEDWKNIRKEIQDSDAVFLLVGPNISPDIRDSAHTQNWIAFEVGIACGCEPPKRVYAFHNAYDPENPNECNKNLFVIPYLTDYIYYNSNVPRSYEITLEIIRTFDPSRRRSVVDGLLTYSDSWMNTTCYNGIKIKWESKEDGIATFIGKMKCPKCQIKFDMFSSDNVILCPQCKEELVLYCFNEL